MALILAEVEQELVTRILPYQPTLAPRLASRLIMLPHDELSLILSSEAALVCALDNVVVQEHTPKVYSCLQGPSILEGQAAQNAILTNRVAQIEPEAKTAARIAEKIVNLGPTVVNECLASDLALQMRMDAARSAIICEETAPLCTSSVRSCLRAVSPLPAARAVSPIRVSPVVTRKYVRRVLGLEAFLVELELTQYSVQANQWAATMGACSLNDIIENQADFADAVGLRPLERSRLLREGPAVAARFQPVRQVLLA